MHLQCMKPLVLAMVPPSDLPRIYSDEEQFAVPGVDNMDDKGCRFWRWSKIKQMLNFERMAKFSVFVTVLTTVGFFQGVLLSYYRSTSQLWGAHYHLPTNLMDWFIFGNEIFGGGLAVLVAYWGERMHKINGMGGLTMVMAVLGGLLAVPEYYHPYHESEIDDLVTVNQLCHIGIKLPVATVTRGQIFGSGSLMMMIFFQIFYGMASVSFIAHGIVFVDNHVSPKHSPGFIGVIIAAVEIGKHVGLYISWTPYLGNSQHVFLCPAWITIVTVTFISGAILALFPKELPHMVMMNSVTSLVTLAIGSICPEPKTNPNGLLKGTMRVLNNNLLMVNILSLLCIESALINFGLMEKHFNQSKYHVAVSRDKSGFSDPHIIQFTTNLMKQPMIAISVITSGVVIAKLKPKIRYLVSWNVAVFMVIALIFGSTVFWNCVSRIVNEHSHIITIPHCSGNCGCENLDEFQPVCIDGNYTYFSPCIAGCKEFNSVTRIYSNCSCGAYVQEGSCDQSRCQLILAVSQANNILIHGLLASTVVSNIIMNMRFVQSRDRVLAIGIKMSMTGVIPYFPVKLIYNLISDTFCEVKVDNSCKYFSDFFTIFLALTTVCLMMGAAALALGLVFMLHDIDLYDRNYSSVLELRACRKFSSYRSNKNAGNETVKLDTVCPTIVVTDLDNCSGASISATSVTEENLDITVDVHVSPAIASADPTNLIGSFPLDHESFPLDPDSLRLDPDSFILDPPTNALNNTRRDVAQEEKYPFLGEPDRPAPGLPTSILKSKRKTKLQTITEEASTSGRLEEAADKRSSGKSSKSDLSSDSLREIADTVGDDHDSFNEVVDVSVNANPSKSSTGSFRKMLNSVTKFFTRKNRTQDEIREIGVFHTDIALEERICSLKRAQVSEYEDLCQTLSEAELEELGRDNPVFESTPPILPLKIFKNTLAETEF